MCAVSHILISLCTCRFHIFQEDWVNTGILGFHNFKTFIQNTPILMKAYKIIIVLFLNTSRQFLLQFDYITRTQLHLYIGKCKSTCINRKYLLVYYSCISREHVTRWINKCRWTISCSHPYSQDHANLLYISRFTMIGRGPFQWFYWLTQAHQIKTALKECG